MGRNNPIASTRIGVFGLFVDGLNAVGSVIIGILMLLICSDVASRTLANKPIAGVSELAAMSIVVIVFLSLASTLRHGRMARADLFIDNFVRRHHVVGPVLDGLFHIAGAVTCGLIVWATIPNLVEAWTRDLFVGVQGVFTAPTWPVRSAVIAGASVAALQFLTMAWARFRAAFSRGLNVGE